VTKDLRELVESQHEHCRATHIVAKGETCPLRDCRLAAALEVADGLIEKVYQELGDSFDKDGAWCGPRLYHEIEQYRARSHGLGETEGGGGEGDS